jgi:phosphatidylglycerol:prolipoprotein diacylglycerol transferase
VPSLAAIAYNPIVHVKIGPLSISPHGVGIAVGFLVGATLMMPAARAKGITEDDVYAFLTRAAIGAILGARLAYVINHAGYYIHHLAEAVQIWKGGISLLGGFFGAILLALPEMRRRRRSFWQVMDAAAPGMALGVLIGRIGDLIVGDHLGKETSFFLGFKCPSASHPTASPCTPGAVVHQTALYDFILVAILLAGLLWLRRKPRYDGFLITVFGAWYGVQRVIEDFLREDTRHFGLTGSQITAILTVLLCLWHLTMVRRTPKWGQWDDEPAVDAAVPAPLDAAEPALDDDAVGEGIPLPPTMAEPQDREE